MSQKKMIEKGFLKKLAASAKEKKLLLLCLAYILLPVSVVGLFAHNLSLSKSLLSLAVNFAIFVLVFVTMMFLSKKAVRICCSSLLLVILLPSAIFLAYLLLAQVFLFPDSIISIFETNPEESKEFIAYYMNPFITLGVLTYASIPVIMIYRIRANRIFSIADNKLVFALCLGILILIPFTPVSNSVYYISFYRTYVHYKKRSIEEKREIANRLKQPFEVKSLLPQGDSQTIVVVIGESLTRHHMSLYGYGRPTNVLLKRNDPNDSLVVYDDVVSPQVHTIPVIRKVLSFVEKEHPDYFSKRPSLFELFNRAGYQTYFISNQPFGGLYETSYDLLITQAKNQINLSVQKKPDGIIFPYLDKALKDRSSKKKLIVIHLMGNHMAYMFRYPKDFGLFDNRKDHFVKSKAKYMTPEAIKSIDYYDNSVRYNDYVMSQIIQATKKNEKNSAVIYFSDHGEEVYEDRDFAGHAYEKVSSYMCEIPFLVWHSPTFAGYRKDIVYAPRKPYSTADFLFSVTDLAGLRYENFNPARSMFNSAFQPCQRYIGDYTYEQVKDMTRNMKKD